MKSSVSVDPSIIVRRDFLDGLLTCPICANIFVCFPFLVYSPLKPQIVYLQSESTSYIKGVHVCFIVYWGWVLYCSCLRHRFCSECLKTALQVSRIGFILVIHNFLLFFACTSTKKCPSCRVHLSSVRDINKDVRLERLISTLHPELQEYRESYMKMPACLNSNSCFILFL